MVPLWSYQPSQSQLGRYRARKKKQAFLFPMQALSWVRLGADRGVAGGVGVGG